MGMIRNMLADAMEGLLAEPLAEAVGAEVQTMVSDRSLKQRIERRAGRDARHLLAAELDVPVRTRYMNVYDFVDDVVLDLYGFHTAQDRRWCAKWWDHPAAVRRLTMMWVSWEKHRIDRPATGEEEWTRVVGDYHMRWLVSPFGPFQSCRDRHVPNPSLPSEQVPLVDEFTDEEGFWQQDATVAMARGGVIGGE
ncbi:hypothetical protein CXF45_10430 [Corynebacterium bovis]|uniref:DUF4913 domain-containing protein n=1 Tax=Corynebacterium bovis TaxID=36808 RepID=UPI000F647A1D|nr:DUF4913 domain-containing protein [Corynebacterium bovis]RRO82665.1 hypothetical protein CXF38_00030 [Corynebacterium bovis]RRO87152.1 hypothetical protein CXF45_10430 [Corynebacterium bovis]